MADGGVRDPARRHHPLLVVALLGLAGLVALILAVLAPSARSFRSGPPGPSADASTRTLGGSRALVALGDSVPSADTCGCTGYVEQVGGRLQVLTHHNWVVHNDATGGWTTADVERDLSTAATHADLVEADLVLIEAGANDFDLSLVDDPDCVPAASSGCWSSTLEGVRAGLTQIIDGIHRINVRPDLRIVLIGYWNVTVDGAVGRALGPGFVLGSDGLTRVVNTTVEQVATRTGTDYVDAYTPLKGDVGSRDPTSDLLQDGDHLNASGHALLANAVIDELKSVGVLAGWTEGKG
ncbi:MAG: SGNH/GDSL hydrolase family protein [Actinomycetota bacterium]|nr:SGNH/GDSL hydrolase family protein [Actinomycetota bacterium]